MDFTIFCFKKDYLNITLTGSIFPLRDSPAKTERGRVPHQLIRSLCQFLQRVIHFWDTNTDRERERETDMDKDWDADNLNWKNYIKNVSTKEVFTGIMS